MNDVLTWALAWSVGCALGVIFFGGLWWTVRQSIRSRHAAAWFFLSSLLRMSITLAGFYFVAGGHWQRLLLCLLGFIMARLLVTVLSRSQRKEPVDSPVHEVSHAP
ncbi:MAG: ATP synthase subunit I [Formivibrio sp.]|nr:ATP synthase subunit I [Formivibrio sp.]